MGLQAGSSTPLYLQLQASLAAQIADGQLRPHDKLPSERQLCQQFGVSRMTVRQAIGPLVQQGIVYTLPGKGVFVSAPSSRLQVNFNLTGYAEATTPNWGELTTKTVDARLVPSTAALARESGLGHPEELVRIQRLRFLGQTPVIFQTLYFPHHLCPGLLHRDFESAAAPIDIIRSAYPVNPRHVDQVIRTQMSGPQEMRRLSLLEPIPLLYFERRTCLDSGEIIEYSTGIYRGDRLHVLLHLDLGQWPARRADEDANNSVKEHR